MMENDRLNNTDNKYYENPQGNAYGAEALPKREYTERQRWLLLAAAALGCVFSWVVFAKAGGEIGLLGAQLRYSAFWLVYLACFYFATWEVSSKRYSAWALAAGAVWLMLRGLVYREENLGFINFLAIPALLMLHAIEATHSFSPERQGDAILAYLRGWFVAPFESLGRFFGAAGSLFKKGSEKSRAVRLGLLVGLPIAALVAMLLIRADAAMGYYVHSMFENIEMGDFIIRLFLALMVAALFYSFIYSVMWSRKAPKEGEYPRGVQAGTAVAALSLLIAVYAVFAVFQFTYLTGLGGLPAGLTYSKYAVNGFSELCVVAGINFILFALIKTFAEDSKGVRALLAALLAATLIVLASAMLRLSMYIGAYGLTFRRILPFWFMLYLVALLGLSAWKLARPRVKLLRLAAGAFVAFYIALSLINLDAMVAKSVLSRAEAEGSLSRADADFLRYALSSDALSAMRDSPLKAQIWYDVEEEDMP